MFERLCSATTPTLGSLPSPHVKREAVGGKCSAAEPARSVDRATGRSVGSTPLWSWCPPESSSCAKEHQSETADAQAKSHTCNQGNAPSLHWLLSVLFIFKLCHSQFLLPCEWREQHPLEPSVWPQPAEDLGSQTWTCYRDHEQTYERLGRLGTFPMEMNLLVWFIFF